MTWVIYKNTVSSFPIRISSCAYCHLQFFIRIFHPHSIILIFPSAIPHPVLSSLWPLQEVLCYGRKSGGRGEIDFCKVAFLITLSQRFTPPIVALANIIFKEDKVVINDIVRNKQSSCIPQECSRAGANQNNFSKIFRRDWNFYTSKVTYIKY